MSIISNSVFVQVCQEIVLRKSLGFVVLEESDVFSVVDCFQVMK